MYRGQTYYDIYFNNKTKTIHCINHSQERISTMFIDDFDVELFLSNTKTYSHEEALSEMQKEEWRNEGLI